MIVYADIVAGDKDNNIKQYHCRDDGGGSGGLGFGLGLKFGLVGWAGTYISCAQVFAQGKSAVNLGLKNTS